MASKSRTSSQRIGGGRLALTGALAAVIFYIVCWVGALLPLGLAPHMYLQLFTGAEPTSGAGLMTGVFWSLAFGLIGGTLFASIFNALAFLDRR